MTWSFDASLSTTRDKVRLRIGDTDTNRQALSDETLDALLTVYGDDELQASIGACRAIIAQYARDTDRSAIGFSTSRSQLQTQMRDLIADLEREQRGGIGAMYVGGSSVAAIDAIHADSDVPESSFRLGVNDYTGD